MERMIDLVGVQMDFGASKRGVNMGPTAIRYAGLCEGLEHMGFQVENLGDIVPAPKGATKPTLRNYEQVVDVNRLLKQFEMLQLITKQFSGGKMPRNMRKLMGKKGGFPGMGGGMPGLPF